MNKIAGLALAGLFTICLLPSRAQSLSRTYANFQGTYRTGLYAVGLETVFGNITAAGNAVDGDPRTFSTPVIGAGLVGLAGVTQFLAFTTGKSLSTVRQISAGTPVYVKLSLPKSLIGLADNIEVGTYSGLHAVDLTINGTLGTGTGNAPGHNASVMTKLYSGSTLLNLLNGAGEMEIRFTPLQSYEGVYVKLGGELLSVALSMQIFHAYILENSTIPCEVQRDAIDVLSGIRGNALVNLLSATGTVSQPWASVDQGPGSLATFSTISTGAQVLSEAFQTVIFSTSSKAGDSLQLIIEDPGAGLLDLNLLSGLKVTPFNGTVAGTPLSGTTLVSLRLLAPGSSRYKLTVPVSTPFDRVEIAIGGVANVASSLRIYDIKRVLPVPVITGSAGTRSADTIVVFKGTPLTLTATSTDPVSWSTSAGIWLGDGPSYSIPAVMTDGIYTATGTRNGCPQVNSTHTVFVKVADHVTLPVRGLTLSGEKEDGRIVIRWTAKGEDEVSHYSLQKNLADTGFADIGKIFASGGADPKYTFHDKAPLTGKNIYRLMVHDQSGAVHYSNVIQVYWDAAGDAVKLRLFPNPVNKNEAQYVSGLKKGEYQLQVISAGGTQLAQFNAKVDRDGSPLACSTANLPTGVYWLKILPLNKAGGVTKMTISFRVQ